MADKTPNQVMRSLHIIEIRLILKRRSDETRGIDEGRGGDGEKEAELQRKDGKLNTLGILRRR